MTTGLDGRRGITHGIAKAEPDREHHVKWYLALSWYVRRPRWCPLGGWGAHRVATGDNSRRLTGNPEDGVTEIEGVEA